MSNAVQARSLGQHLAQRLQEVGCDRFFGVPGDYNLSLLDELEKDNILKGTWCCNELNAGYAADGFARVRGVGCAVVTFTVGGLSLINAIAGAYAESLPVICVVGGPNSNDLTAGRSRLVHHTIGNKWDMLQEMQAFKQVTCEQVMIQSLEDAHEEIDKAISAALTHSKPVYICICCNLAGMHHPSFDRSPIPYQLSSKQSNQRSLEAAVDAAVEFLDSKQKPVVVAGYQMRIAKAAKEFIDFVDASGYAFANMAAAKSLVPESHPQHMGTYFGQISDPCVAEVVESADAYLFCGPLFNDYAAVGNTLGVTDTKMLRVDLDRVIIAGGKGGQVFGCVRMNDFMAALARRIKPNSNSMDIYKRLFCPAPEVPPSPEGSPLQTKTLFKHIGGLLDPSTLLLAETGDSIFNCQKLSLPDGCQYNWSQQYGSIGWSVGATLGLALGGKDAGKRVLACIGDGSFQLTAQEVSTMMRYETNPIIFLINNGGYTIEVEIHDGPYNVIKNWDYVKFVEAMHNDQGRLYATRVRTEAELVEAIDMVQGDGADKLCFIECMIHRDDCSKELLEWGARVSAANSRPPACSS
ncbi:hypothetical protein D9Q98_007346 [Chlorella vulgaris]|uniref:pyruvate decarboxylase n=1 Tax=Chlorella vulgaris TaxID=3077 RepID=A0A9D4TL94_CHLVU|nr:hypothetical protein D9Q98_007346 [Chlorella vulgaris]